MKHLFRLTLYLLIPFIVSCEAELSNPDQPAASQGTYIGVVHVSYPPATGDGEIQYVCYRMHPEINSWNEIGWTPRTKWADHGYLLPSNEIIPGKTYEYRIRAHTDDAGFSDYSPVVTGYAFEAEMPEITSLERKTENGSVKITVTWSDPNELQALENLDYIDYQILRKEEGTSQDFTKVGELECNYDPNTTPPEFYFTDEQSGLESDKTYIYKVKADYGYSFINVNGDFGTGLYQVDGEIASNEGSGTNPTADYTAQDLGQVLAASGGGIPQIKEKVIGGTVYLGVIQDAGATAIGKPRLYSYSGSSWEQVWTSDPGEEFDQIHFAVGSSHSYVAGTTDSLYVFAWDGSAWSGNLTPDNLGKDDSPSDVSIESYNDELYMALFPHPDYHLQVMKYNGPGWDAIGGDASGVIATGSLFQAEVEQVDGNLYLKYIQDNTAHIKRLNGSSWEEVLSWDHEYLNDIEIARNGGDLYFIAQSNALVSYPGGIYKVTGTSSAESLVSAQSQWFVDPLAIAVDPDGNVVLTSFKYESQSVIYPFVNVYDGNDWKTISDDFTGGMDPAGLSVVNTDIYYMFGQASSENSMGDATVIESKKYTK